MVKQESSDVAIISSKGQVVIPQALRKKLGLLPKTKLLVYRIDDAIIMKKIELPDIRKELEQVYEKVDQKIAKFGDLPEEEIESIIHKYRRNRRDYIEGP